MITEKSPRLYISTLWMPLKFKDLNSITNHVCLITIAMLINHFIILNGITKHKYCDYFTLYIYALKNNYLFCFKLLCTLKMIEQLYIYFLKLTSLHNLHTCQKPWTNELQLNCVILVSFILEAILCSSKWLLVLILKGNSLRATHS